MMDKSWTTNLLRDVCVYWEPPNRDGLGGYEWCYAVELMSRWQYGLQGRSGPVLVYSPEGSQIIPRTEVWVNKDIQLGGYLWRGTIKQTQTVFDPDPSFEEPTNMLSDVESLAAQIIEVKLVESIVNKNNILRKAYLQ